MDKYSFDDNLAGQLMSMDITPSASVWQKVDQRLSRRKRRRVFLFWWLPALMITAGTGIFLTNRDPHQETQMASSQRQLENVKSEKSPNTPTDVIHQATDFNQIHTFATQVQTLLKEAQEDYSAHDSNHTETKIELAHETIEGQQQNQSEPTLASTATVIDTTQEEQATTAEPAETPDRPASYAGKKSSWKFRLGAHGGLSNTGNWNLIPTQADELRSIYSGAAMPSVSAPPAYQSNVYGYNMGIHFNVDKSISKNITLSSGIGVTSVHIENQVFLQNFSMLEFPLLLNYAWKPESNTPFSINAGFAYSPLLSHTTEMRYSYLSISPPYDISKQQWQFRTGIQTIINKNGNHPITVGVTERVGLHPIWNSGPYGKQRLYLTQLEISWGFGSKKPNTIQNVTRAKQIYPR